MSFIIKHLVPYKWVLKYFFNRFLGKYCDIDLENADFSGDEVVFRDLELNVRTLNETIKGKTPLKFIQCKIGELKINFKIGRQIMVKVNVDKIDVIMIPITLNQNQTEDGQKMEESKSGQKNDVEKEGVIDELLGSILKNLEVSVTNVAIRVQQYDNKEGDPQLIPTILLRLTSLKYSKAADSTNQKAKYNYLQEIHCLLHDKKLTLGEISVHLMKNRKIAPNDLMEFDNPEEYKFNTAVHQLQFPFQYPHSTHPNTLMLFKGEQNAFEMDLSFSEPSQLQFQIGCGNLEAMLSQRDLVVLSKFVAILTENKNEDSGLDKSGVSDLSLSQSFFMESRQFRLNFKESMKKDSELMKSIEDISSLNESLPGLPIQNIPVDQINIIGTASLNLLSVALFCQKDGTKTEDKLFKIFKQGKHSTSAEIYYEFSLRDLSTRFQKKPNKSAATIIYMPQILLKSYLRGSRIEDSNIYESDLMQTAYNNQMEETDLFHSAVGDQSFQFVNQSTSEFLDANQFQIVELQPAPQFQYSSETILEIQKTELKVKSDQIQFSINKVRLHVNSTDLLIGLYLGNILKPNEEEAPSLNSDSKPQKKKRKGGIEIQKSEVKSIEIQFYMHKVNSYSFLKLGELPLPENLVFDKSSIGLSLSARIETIDQILNVTLGEVNLNAIIDRSTLTLMSIKYVKLQVGCEYQPTEKRKYSIPEVQIIDEDEDEDNQPIQFISNSSSNDGILGPQAPLEETRLQYPDQSLVIVLQGVLVQIDSRDFDKLSTFIVQQEQALKHTSNILDIYSLIQKQITKKPLLLPTTNIQIYVEDLRFQLLSILKGLQGTANKVLMELNLNQIDVDLSLGGTRNVSCIEVKVTLKQILLLDMLNEYVQIYNPYQDEFIKFVDSEQNMQSSSNTYIKQLYSGRAIVHEIKPQSYVLAVDCQICFVEEGSMQERVDLSFVQTDDLLQLFVDFGEMKLNPMRLKVQANLKNLNFYCTNQTLKLGQQVQRLSAKLKNRLLFAKRDQNPSIQPRQKCVIDTSKQSTFVDLRLENISVAFQPVLQLQQLQKVLSRPEDKKWSRQEDQKLFKAHQVAVLRINRTTLTSNTLDHHSFQTDQISVLFLADNNPQNLENWVNYSESGERIAELGFVQVLDVSNIKSIVKHKQVRLYIQSIKAGMCSDLLKQVQIFQSLTLLSFENAKAEDLQQSVLDIRTIIPLQPQKQIEESKQSEPAEVPILAQDDIFVVVVGGNNEKVQYLYNNSKSPSSVSQEKVDLTLRIDQDYFNEANTKVKNIRKNLHRMQDFLSDPQLEVTFDISLLKIVLFKGADLDFKQGVATGSSPLQRNSEQNSFSSSSQLLTSQNQRSKVTEFDANYLNNPFNKITLDQEIARQASFIARRPRTTQRDTRRYFQVSVSDFCTTLRQFCKSPNNSEISTLSLSIGNCQISLFKDKFNELQMLDSPYCYRQRNLIELSCMLQTNEQIDFQELQLEVALRPIKVFVSQAPIDFVNEYLKALKSELEDPKGSIQQPQSSEVGKTNDKNEVKEKPWRVRSILIKESQIQIQIKHLEDYKIGGPFVNFDFPLKIERYLLVIAQGKDLISVQEAIGKVTSNYIAQAQRWDQLYRLLSSYKPFRSIGRGVYSICAPIYKPLIGARYGSVGVVSGFSEGVQDLTGYLQNQSYGWTMYFIRKLY